MWAPPFLFFPISAVRRLRKSQPLRRRRPTPGTRRRSLCSIRVPPPFLPAISSFAPSVSPSHSLTLLPCLLTGRRRRPPIALSRRGESAGPPPRSRAALRRVRCVVPHRSFSPLFGLSPAPALSLSCSGPGGAWLVLHAGP
jgi:hypothetical protein